MPALPYCIPDSCSLSTGAASASGSPQHGISVDNKINIAFGIFTVVTSVAAIILAFATWREARRMKRFGLHVKFF
ncbi:MAG: hypothetical protein FRX48_09464 [Lasallia pustulata]|uniref:Uncharacterized protein n=1 Tax=Lasallia pustulata TaxID=136370 RepID=A0A5M8PBW9_9LECA|nr:MAG: hypothetical protein FRX48_09464 [Lasallia pustulata]